ncbi:proline-rich receptor-like protein kinase PERK10 [Vitis riparia]|uniref:proline-rich receptor-like protein kinase PERK10 n=1 Tax=Vitis riparia TaxID=96939 RepID=UPI00155A81E9|nr:proline-rich receptor-like protein kinase PERK10 [Vitis riparia]
MTEPSQPLVVPPSVEGTPPSPPLRRYETRRPPTTLGASSARPKKSASRPPKKKARISAPIEPSVPSSEPQPPPIESQIPSRMTLEVIIRQPMVTQPPIEEKVHRKKLLRADAIPLLFPRLLCQILEHLGYPSEPQLERRRLFQEIFTLEKWTSMIAYDVEPEAPAGHEHLDIPQPEHPEEPQSVEIPANTRALSFVVPSTEPMPKVASSTHPATPGTPPVVPSPSEPPPPSESRIAISISEFRGLCHTLQTLTTSQSILTQQMEAIRSHQYQFIATQT